MLPSTVGRYDVIGEIATGGMAQILLARLLGPSGFERPVVIKRILPHLAKQESFVAMFLDEARLIARIRHNNVVQVTELGRERDELFMALEYLQGETCSVLLKRLLARNAPRQDLPSGLDGSLSAFIVAEACAGLHAAHELRDENGATLGIVHRDVSPQNLFITYDGQTKVLDFGIAKSADRIARTEAGQVKGKIEYMSPEQARGAPLDRRSDVFSLGVVLYELTTGRRLFKRPSYAQVLEAIFADPIPPSRLVRGYPARLETICLRALAQDPDDRYPTAAEMRRELLETARSLGAEVDPSAALAGLMKELFADRIAEKEDLLRRCRSDAQVTHVPPGEVYVELDLPGVADTGVGTKAATPASTRRRRTGARRKIALATAAALLVAASAAFWLLRPRLDRWSFASSRGRAGGLVIPSKLRAAWVTPHAVFWQWDVTGIYDKLRQPLTDSYGVVLGSTEEDVLSRRAPIWTGARNPELVFNYQGRPTAKTITDGYTPGSRLFAQVFAIDRFSGESVTELVMVRTPEMPRDQLEILTERPISQPAHVEPTWLKPHTDVGGSFPLCRGTFCYAGTADAACSDFDEGCHHNVKITDASIPLPALSREQFERTAMLELALATNSAAPAHNTKVWIGFGSRRAEIAGIPFRHDNHYQLVEIPLRELRTGASQERLSYDRIEAWRASSRPGVLTITQIGVGIRITSATLLRFDDVRLRW